jgi:hypothetical protein
MMGGDCSLFHTSLKSQKVPEKNPGWGLSGGRQASHTQRNLFYTDRHDLVFDISAAVCVAAMRFFFKTLMVLWIGVVIVL